VPLDKEKIISNALKFVQKGQHDKALKEYLRILEVEPNEVRILLRVAELCARMGDSQAAVEMYMRVADIYTSHGFFLKAVAVYKNVLKIDENRLDAYEKLADLYIQLGLLNDAKAQFSQLADIHEKNGRARELLQSLKRVVDLDPGDFLNRVKLGEMFARDGHLNEAAEELQSAASSLKIQGRLDEYTRVAERFFSLRPSAIDVGTELAHIYLERRDPKKALQKLQLCYKANPKDPRTLELLAEAFGQLEMPHHQIPAYKELYKVYLDLNRTADAEALLRKLQELSPEDAEKLAGQQALRDAAPEAPPREPATQEPAVVAEEAVEPEQVVQEEPVQLESAVPAEEAAQQPKPLHPAARSLTEADIYIKYGLLNKAMEAVEDAIKADPDSIEAYRKLRFIHDRAGETEASCKDLLAIANLQVKSGETEEAKSTLYSLLELKPDDPVAQSLLDALEGNRELPAPAQDFHAGPEVVESIHIDMDGEADRHEEDFEIDIGGDLEHDDAVLTSEIEIPISHGGVPVSDQEPPASEEQSSPGVSSAPSHLAPDVHTELEGEIEEARFLFEQGLLEEAREALLKALEGFPGEPRAEELLAKVEQRLNGTTGSHPPAEHVEELKDVLEEIPLSQSSGRVELNEILNQFRKSVSETVSPGDARTHFDLGCAYRDMGLYNDAVNEFNLAMTNEEIELKALNMIAVCHLENKEYDKAINTFKKALYYDEITPEQTLDFLYEIGLAYEVLGDPDEALYYLRKVGKKHPGYRDIDVHLERIMEQKDRG
jgi:tetratricopeptide (TPR) repeat protein